MKPTRHLVRVAHGSHLYGTTTPTSDQDFKGVHLPSGRAILLGRGEQHINRSIVSKGEGTDKNTADAIDDESYSVAKFFEMLTKGDTVATEVLFAPVPPDADPLWPVVQTIGRQLLNRQCKGFVGYCIRQAAKYGIKGSRMRAVKDVLDFISIRRLGLTATAKLSAIEVDLRNWSAGREHVSWENIPNPNGTDNWHLNVCDRKMPMTVTINEAFKVWEKVWINYGERARAAMTNEGIDWKAVSHAVRVARQAIELLSTGTIAFPRPDAAELLEIKQGKRPYDEVSKLLEQLVAEVAVAAEASSLPASSDLALMDETVINLYRTQVIHG